MATHELKTCHEKAFPAIWRGIKRYEVRKYDRDYEVGDIVILHEYDRAKHEYLHRSVTAKIIFMTPGGCWDLPGDVCVFGTEEVSRKASVECEVPDE